MAHLFNYISTLRTNCDPSEPCMSIDCRPVITCLDIEFPSTFGVEFGGTIINPYTADPLYPDASEVITDAVTCAGGNADLVYHLGTDVFSFVGGDPLEVTYYADRDPCTWCPAESDDFVFDDPPEPTSEFDLITGCEPVTVEANFCKGYIADDGADVGWAGAPEESTCFYDCCEVDDAGGSDTYSYTLEDLPQLLCPRVEITTIIGGLHVFVNMQIYLLGRKLVSHVDHAGCGDPFTCEGSEIENFDPDHIEYTCSTGAGNTLINIEFNQDFPGATGWDDIKDIPIPGEFTGGGYFFESPTGFFPGGCFRDECDFVGFDFHGVRVWWDSPTVTLRDLA